MGNPYPRLQRQVDWLQVAFSVGLLIAFPYALFEVRGRSNQYPPGFFFGGGPNHVLFFSPWVFVVVFKRWWHGKVFKRWWWDTGYGGTCFSEGKSSAIITKQHRFVDVMRLPLPLSAHFLHENPLSESSRWCASRFSFIAANRWRYWPNICL